MTTLTELLKEWIKEPGFVNIESTLKFAKKIDEEYELVEKTHSEACKDSPLRECNHDCPMRPEVGKSECEDGLCVGGGGVICKKHFQQAYEKLWGPEVEKKECTRYAGDRMVCDDCPKHGLASDQPRLCEHGRIIGKTCVDCGGNCLALPQPPVLPELPGELLISKENSFYNIVEPINQIIRYLTALRAKECNTKE